VAQDLVWSDLLVFHELDPERGGQAHGSAVLDPERDGGGDDTASDGGSGGGATLPTSPAVRSVPNLLCLHRPWRAPAPLTPPPPPERAYSTALPLPTSAPSAAAASIHSLCGCASTKSSPR
jgi:hypothetical protein